MKKLLILIGAIAAYGTDCTISDTVRTPFGGYFAGRIVVALNSPASAQPLYSGSQTLTGWQTTIEVPSTANGVVAFTLVCTDTITPSGTSYSARYQPTSGSGWAETWSPTTGTTTIRAMRATTVPTPTTTFQASQIVPGTNGQVLTTTAGASAWGSVPACATCVVTSGSYADPAWLTSLAGSKVSGAVASATLAASATALATPRTIAGVSFNGTANISIASTNLSDTANIVRNNAANTYTAGSKQTFAHSATTAGLNVGVQAAAPSSPAQGDVFFNTTLTRKGVYDGTQWRYELYAPSSGTGVVSWDGTSLSASTTLAGLSSVTSTSFTGALTGNASTATALASTVASGAVMFGQGTGVPATDASYFSHDSTRHITSFGNYVRVMDGPNTSPLSGSSLELLMTSSMGFLLPYNRTAALRLPLTISTSYLLLEAAGAERARFAATTGNLLIGTTTDLGYGLHAANRGTNGNLLVFDPTATTGVTTAVFQAGAANDTSTGTVLSVRDNAGTARAQISGQGFQWGRGYVQSSSGTSTGTPQVAVGFYRTGITHASTGGDYWSSTSDASATPDLSLSRASAGVLQVGDGGANANGYLSAARIGVGTASPGGIGGLSGSILDVRGYIITANNKGLLSLDNAGTALNTLIRQNASDGTEFYTLVNYDWLINSSSKMRLNTTGNLLIGGTTDGNYKLDVQNSGSSGTLRVYDQTATTGNTKEVIRAGAGQSTNLTEWQNNAGTVLASVSSLGTIYSSQRLHTTGDVLLNNSGAVVMDTGGDGVLRLRDNSGTNFYRIQLGGTTSSFPALKRSSAILQARLADDSAYTDIGVNAVIVNKAAPSASSDACTAGQLWAGDMGGTKYAFYCVASGTIVRSAFASF